MKKIILLFLTLCFIFSLTGCDDEKDMGIPLNDYAARYQNILSPYETLMSERVNFTYLHMINVETYIYEYNNVDMQDNLTDLMTTIDTMLYELSVLGPELTNELLMDNQSELEYALVAINNIYKDFSTHQVFTTKAPSQFTLYSETFHMLDALSEPLQQYNESTLNIESYLASQEITLDEQYITSKHKNIMRFDYLYAVFASQIATYGENIGLTINPNRTEFTKNKDHYYRVSELDPLIMVKVSEFLSEQVDFIKQIQFDDEILGLNHIDYFNHYITTYEMYSEFRNTLPLDFYKSGEFMTHQSWGERPLDFRYMSMWRLDEEITRGYFDYNEEFYDDTIYDELDEHYLTLQRQLFASDHQSKLFYDHIELLPAGVLFEQHYAK